ncbi:MAG: hypothetical protein FWC62_00245 [Firmicutes bacterium]|nr:hypothetical protein [Bacillota bacterium]
MSKKKRQTDNVERPTNPANLSQTNRKRNKPAGAENGAGLGAGRGPR